MKDINWFKYKEYLGYAIDLARIFPLINKQRGISNFFVGLASQLFEIPILIWIFFLELETQLFKFLMGLVPIGIIEIWLHILRLFRIETGLQLFSS